MIFISDKKNYALLLMVVAILAGASNFAPMGDLLSFGAVAVSLILLIVGDPLQNLYLLIALIPFYTSLSVGHMSFYGIFPFIASVKILQENKPFGLGFLLCCYVVIVLFLHDRTETSLMNIFNLGSFLFYVSVAAYMLDLKKYDYRYSLGILLMAVIISQISIYIVQGGNIDAFFEERDLRLGEGDVEKGQKNRLGGAMGFPIYSMLVISSLCVYLKNFSVNTWMKIMSVLIILMEFFVTFFTISKVYLLGLSSFAVVTLIYDVRFFSFKRTFVVMLSLVLVAVLFLFVLGDTTQFFISNYERRLFSIEITSGRSYIYDDVILYLSQNISSLLFGEGRWGYTNIGLDYNYAFKMSAHNIVLDGIMIYGLLGMAVIAGMYCTFLKKYHIRKIDVFDMSPLICWLMMNMTASTFIVEKNYIMVVVLLLNACFCWPKIEEKNG